MLTDLQIKRERAKRRTAVARLSDGRGMSLVLPVSGQPFWRFDFRLAGKRRTMSLGMLQDVTLASARKRLQEARAQVAVGQDPVEARRVSKAVPVAPKTFQDLAEEWLRRKTRTLSEKTQSKKRWMLDSYILPALGKKPVADITPSAVLAMLRKIEARELFDTTRRTCQVVGEILRYGIATELAERDVTRDLAGALETAPIRHRPALTEPKEVGQLLRAIRSLDTPITRGALQLLALTFVRPGELRVAKWEEMDLNAAVWRVPDTRTKQRATHIVPLSRQALVVLDMLKAESRGSAYVLPTPRTILRPLSNAAFSASLARIGYSADVMTPHGFRAMARTLLDEQLHQSPDVIEAQLAHVTRGALGDTYNRSRYLPQRAALMQTYADYLDMLMAQV